MQAVVLRGPKDLAVLDVPRQALVPGQCMIKVSHCGICGSDIRYYYGENPWAKQTLGIEVENPPNIILGHEFVGVVVEVADDGDLALLGQRVAVNTFITCGRCDFCRTDRENLCPNTKHLGHGQGWGEMEYYPGGMAEFCIAFANQVYPLPEHVSSEEATFLDPMIASLHATDVGNPQMMDKVAILGAGPIGLLIAQFAQVYGVDKVFISDVAEENLQVAHDTGVAATFNASDSDASYYDFIMDQTGGEGIDVVYNTVGSQESIEEALKMLKPGGTLVLLATKEPVISFKALQLSGERTIKTSSNAMYSDFPRALAMLASGKVNVKPLISHRFPVSKAVEAFDVACRKQETGAIKIVLDCQS